MYKLVIVDDEYEIRMGLCRYFPWRELGFEVVGQFADGHQVLEFCQEHHVDVILSDIKMPGIDGISLAKHMYEEKPQIKMVFISGFRDFDYARKALNYGVRDYILKPTKYEELYTVFSKIKEELDNKDHLDLADDKTEGHNYYEQVISRVKKYLVNEYRNATLEEAAKLVHLSPNYLSKLFKEQTGENFSDFLIKIRMTKAAELLGDISLKTYQVSDLVGYSNPKNFTRTFKKYYGKTPKEFRNA
ncbi:MAG: response regulator [Firmicutes bacterium]|nr:response regulator [Bacillota bacterium]